MKRILNFKLVWLLLFVTPLLASTCRKDSEFCHSTIVFKNSSEKDVFLDFNYSYPDTTRTLNVLQLIAGSVSYKSWKGTINHDVLFLPLRTSRCWENLFTRKTFENDTASFYIIDAEKVEYAYTVNGYKGSPEEMLLQRYDLSLQDLQKLNFQLSYPPTEAMQDMKMYPKFKP